MFFFIYIWYGIRIIRIYSKRPGLNKLINQRITGRSATFQGHFKLGIRQFHLIRFRIISGCFKTFPASDSGRKRINGVFSDKNGQKKGSAMAALFI
ncbi:hypothetical protein CKF43_19420 [Pantoea graminicola]|nr:hypothetical protein CKF43_19420 [Pantoea sp. ARC607]